MFKHYFEQIDGIATGPVISLIIFFSFFIGLGYWLYKISDQYVKNMRDLPLEEDSDMSGASSVHSNDLNSN